MYTPVSDTRPEFMKYYEAVMKGDEVIGTAKRLKDSGYSPYMKAGNDQKHESIQPN